MAIISLVNNVTIDSTNNTVTVCVSGGLAVLSTILCCVAVFVMVRNQMHKIQIYRFILYSLLSTAILSIDIVFNMVLQLIELKHTIEKACEIIAFFRMWSLWSLFIIVAGITNNLCCLVHENRKLEGICIEIVYIVLTFLFPAFIVWIPFLDNSFGDTYFSCWVTPSTRITTILITECSLVLIGVLIVFNTIVTITTLSSRSFGGQIGITDNFEDANDKDDQDLNLTKKYRQALKETIPFLLFSSIIPFSPITAVVNSMMDNEDPTLNAIHLLLDSMLGGFVGLMFLLHFYQLKRNRLKKVLAEAQVPRPHVQHVHYVSTAHPRSIQSSNVFVSAGDSVSFKTTFPLLQEEDIDDID